jgi:hypothetical protein
MCNISIYYSTKRVKASKIPQFGSRDEREGGKIVLIHYFLMKTNKLKIDTNE